MHKQNGFAPCASVFFTKRSNNYISSHLNLMVKFIDPMVKTKLCMMQNLSYLYTINVILCKSTTFTISFF